MLKKFELPKSHNTAKRLIAKLFYDINNLNPMGELWARMSTLKDKKRTILSL